jgi:hypothetical protein
MALRLANTAPPQCIEILLRLIRQVVHRPLHPPAPFFDVAVAGNGDRVTVQEKSARERTGDDQLIPGMQQLFFFAVMTSGTMGSPVARAAHTTPSLAIRGGPFGPSGVKTIVFPARDSRINSRRAALPPRVLDPRAESTPYRRSTPAMISPSFDLEMITVSGSRYRE